VAVPTPPHAANRSATIIANEKNIQDNRAFLAKDDSFLSMFMTITSSRFNGALMTTSDECNRRSKGRYAKRLQILYAYIAVFPDFNYNRVTDQH